MTLLASAPHAAVNAVPQPRSTIEDIDSPELSAEDLRAEVKRLQGENGRLLCAAAQYSGRTISHARFFILGY